MTFNMKRFPGALVVAGLVAACGGEELNPGNAEGGTGHVESGLTSVTTGGGETVVCVDGSIAYYWAGFECKLAQNFSHQYRTGGTVILADGNAEKQYVRNDGFVDFGYLASNQGLYVGTENGSVTFAAGKRISIYGTSLQDGQITEGWLTQATCLKSSSTTWRACAAGQAGFQVPTGYVFACNNTTSITCP